MKILSAEQIRNVDQTTIEQEKITSIELMERAARACCEKISHLIPPKSRIIIFCGEGNNGGDGFAISRMLHEKKFEVTCVSVNIKNQRSDDAEKNYQQLKKHEGPKIIEINSDKDLATLEITEDIFCVDALLGTGINKAAEGLLADVIDHINKYKWIISIDVPSGLFIDSSSANNKHIVRCNLCLTFQIPKLAFLFAGNAAYVPEFEILDIGLNVESISQAQSPHHYLTLHDIKSLWKTRTKFSHKGTYGHGLLLAGSKGKSGAAVLTAKAAMKSGMGLLTVHSTEKTLAAINISLPESMTDEDANTDFISEIDGLDKYSALAFGPGTGTATETQLVLKKILNYSAGKLVIDADGLNILSENKTWLSFLPANTILTPHPKEFERLTEKETDDFERLKILKQFSIKNNCMVILKGAHTAIAMPDGNVFFNSTGNPGLAKGGSGDVLTGIILGLLSRGYNAPQAALIGCFVHGLAADLCAKKMSLESICATDVIRKLPEAYRVLES